MSWDELVAPSVELARDGFPVSDDLAEILAAKQSWLTGNPATASE